MKRGAVLLAIVVLSFIAADAAANAPAKPNTFPTMTACKAALESGNFRYYEPKYHGLRSKNPVNGVDRVRVELETDMCIKMLVVGGRRYVVQKEETPFRAHKLPDGSLSLYARDDCGNPVYDTVFPAPPPVAVVEPEPEPEPLVIPRELPPPPIERVVYREREKKGGFCSSTKCRLLVLGAAAGLGYGIYYNWPCPPGTSRR